MVERSLSMREVPGSMPGFSKWTLSLKMFVLSWFNYLLKRRSNPNFEWFIFFFIIFCFQDILPVLHTIYINFFNYQLGCLQTEKYLSIRVFFGQKKYLSSRCRICWLYLLLRDRTPLSSTPNTHTHTKKKRKKNGVLGITIAVRIQLWRFAECGVSLLYHYSQVLSDPEWLCLLRFHRTVKEICLKIIPIGTKIKNDTKI